MYTCSTVPTCAPPAYFLRLLLLPLRTCCYVATGRRGGTAGRQGGGGSARAYEGLGAVDRGLGQALEDFVRDQVDQHGVRHRLGRPELPRVPAPPRDPIPSVSATMSSAEADAEGGGSGGGGGATWLQRPACGSRARRSQ